MKKQYRDEQIRVMASQGFLKAAHTFKNYEQIRMRFLKYLGEFRKKRGDARVRCAQLMVDKAILNRFHEPECAVKEWMTCTCHSGCSECCHMIISATDEEALFALKKANEIGYTIDLDRLEIQSKITDNDEFWALPPEQNRCVFLGDNNKCAIYEYRPLACRAYYVANGNGKCKAGSKQQIEILFSSEAETIIAGYSTARCQEKNYEDAYISLQQHLWRLLGSK